MPDTARFFPISIACSGCRRVGYIQTLGPITKEFIMQTKAVAIIPMIAAIAVMLRGFGIGRSAPETEKAKSRYFLVVLGLACFVFSLLLLFNVF